jgi:3-dehydroquinate dehydratase-2
MRDILILQGPNLNLLGQREPETYGTVTLADVTRSLNTVAETLGVRLRHVQSNHEGALVDAIQHAGEQGVSGAVVNAGAFTHTSVAIRDALLGVGMPFVEIHVTNVHAREPFRHRSYLADVAVGVVCGLGTYGYELALRGLMAHLDD